MVHLFAEMRKVMPEAMELSYTTAEPKRPGARMKAMLLEDSSEKSKVRFAILLRECMGKATIKYVELKE